MSVRARIRAAARAVAALAFAGLLSFVARGAPAGDGELTDVDRKVMATLTEVRETPRALFHFAPGAIAAADLDAAVAANVAALTELEKTLAMKYRGRVHFFLYRSIDEMTALTGAGGGTV